MPRKYRNPTASALHVMAIERIVQPGEIVESDVELSGPFVEIIEAPERIAAEPQVN